MVRTVTEPATANKDSGKAYNIPGLPLKMELETKEVLKKTRDAARALAELKGSAKLIPKQRILTATLTLQEAKDSSEIENIVTTQDELHRSDPGRNKFTSPAAKEVHMYDRALVHGYRQVTKNGLLPNSLILEIQSMIIGNNAGFRTQAGTVIKNEQSGEIIYTPPQDKQQIATHMTNLERFINKPELSELDPLVKMAVIHHQFESIHPFFDGNGRTGRIINILYLVQCGLLNTPVLYLSRYINQNKEKYYSLLRAIQDQPDEDSWISWILFILDGVEQTSQQTIAIINNIKELMAASKKKIRDQLPKIYSQDLLNNIFSNPYTRGSYLAKELRVTRPTAARYLNALVKIGELSKLKHGRETYYKNHDLYDLLMNVSTGGNTAGSHTD